MTDDVYVWNDALPFPLFKQALDEFHPMYNFRYEDKVEAAHIPIEIQRYYPTWSGIEKPSLSEGLGDSLPLIKVGVHMGLQVKKVLKRELKLVRINTNIQRFGQEATFHTDGPEGDWTCLVFISPHWCMEWGGDFVIQLGERDYRSIPYFPNKAILFKAHLQHRGSAPNVLCNRPRYSLAFTFESPK